jgi:hypothetical protein
MEQPMSHETNTRLAAESSHESGQPNRGPAKKADYEIGYGKPPKATRFKKGQSGNPAGAKKKVVIDDVRVMVEEVLAELIILRDGGKDRKVSRLEAMLRTQVLNALKGDSKAAKAIFKLSQKAGMFSQAKRRGTVVIDPPGSTPEERMLLRAFRAEQETQLLEQPVAAADRRANRNKG